MDIYRLRSIDSLLGEYSELQNQSIYFAHPSKLNDPMEGYRDIYWKGDSIVWRNLFKHYLMCLEHVFKLLIDKQHHLLNPENIPIFKTDHDFPDEKSKKIFEGIKSNFFDASISKFIENIASRKRKIRVYELSFFLTFIHHKALEDIVSEYKKNNLFPHPFEFEPMSSIRMIQSLNEEFFRNTEEIESDFDFFSTVASASAQMKLNNKMSFQDESSNFVFLDFVEHYLNQIPKLIYPEWFTACFMSDCTNSSVWGHYGKNHTGACLIFNTNLINDKPHIKLNGLQTAISSSGPVYQPIDFEFRQISYVKGYRQINFFRSLAQQPINDLNNMWYTFDTKISTCSKHIYKNNNSWHKKHWDNFHHDQLIKTRDWRYEKEYRLILSSTLNNSNNRTLTYDFSSLKGIIFGIKTSHLDKLKIIDLIKEKCKKNCRSDFKFYQAYYSPKTKTIDRIAYDLLKI